MRNLRRNVPVALALTLSVFGSACGVVWHNRPILRRNKPGGGSQTLLNATRDELNQRLLNLYNAINSFQARVDMTPSVGSVYKGQITEYKDINAFILFRKPAEIRIIGQLPVVRTTAFDMVSNGSTFRFLLHSKNLFFEGSNDAPATSQNKIENLRPEAFLASMLIRPVDASMETAALEDSTDEDTAIFVLHFIRRDAGGQPYIYRNVWFDRLDLSIVRQKILDPKDGLIVSDTRYGQWQVYNGVSFPAHIDINRPKDGYGVSMNVTQMQMNKEMTDQQFVLAKPEGATLRPIGEKKP